MKRPRFDAVEGSLNMDAAGMRSALEMIADCFRHQHPEAFGRPPVSGPVLPIEVRYGRDDMRQSPPAQSLMEEPMGDPNAVPLPDVVRAGGPDTDL
jgi:hypothetical protein